MGLACSSRVRIVFFLTDDRLLLLRGFCCCISQSVFGNLNFEQCLWAFYKLGSFFNVKEY